MDTSIYLAFIPAAIVIILALVTKKTHLSLCIGIYVGAVILSGGNPLTAFPVMFRDYIIPPLTSAGNIRTIIIIIAIQGLAKMLKMTGAGPAMANAIKRAVKTKRGAETLTTVAGFGFIYTEPCFLLGVVMRPITEAYKVTKIKLAYICDSLGCNMAALSPICSYGPYYVGLIAAELALLGLPGDGWNVYGQYWIRNFYSIIAIIVVYFVCITGKDIGKLWLAERRADITGQLEMPGDVPVVPDNPEDFADASREYPVRNFLIPMGTMLVVLFGCVFWEGNIVENGLIGFFRNCSLTLAIACGLVAAGLSCIVVGKCEKMFTIVEGFQKWLDGCCIAMSVVLILALAWGLSSISSALQLKELVALIVEGTGFPPALIPAVIFLAGAVMSFATGSSWGTSALLMPIAVPICYEYGLGVAVGAAAAIAGGLFGDHCSPISDTTIKASMASGSDHIAHVTSQLPYSLTAGCATFIAYLIEGLTNSLVIALVAGIAIAITAVIVQNKMTVKKYADYDFSAELETGSAANV
ncbi:MAG: Na+/H+ antiporter NhaC family protein [Firmicutes bacterium]|nr:Na+/H+ antiporter NhaC family protein [Bacillota bacterium]MDY5856311.1 Na+/H+ antiporter NhaC family protein [Anaerovoracaceae bacterium]